MKDNELKLTALPIKKLAEILNKSGSREVSETKIRADIESGAPVANNGTVNLIEYTAWLVANHGGGHGD
jgi:hypothetical protein